MSAPPPSAAQPAGPTDASAGPPADGPRRRRRTVQPRAVAAVALVWVLLWDRITLGNVVNGVLVGLLVTWAFPLPSIAFTGRVRPLRVASLVARFVTDLVAASWQVLRLALGTSRPRNAVVGVQLRSRSDFYLTLTAELVALVPGSVVVDARRSRSVLYLHLLDVGRPGAVDAQRRHVLAVEERVVRALGSAEEVAALERAAALDPDGLGRVVDAPADRAGGGGGTALPDDPPHDPEGGRP